MLIIPAIDIKNGNCVRLEQGDFSRSTVYGDDPLEMALRWESLGVRRLHIVDLDGSRQGAPANGDLIARIIAALQIPVQIGGGIRNIEAARRYADAGAAAIILGTSALKDPVFTRQVCAELGERVFVGIDALDGLIALEGWIEKSNIKAAEIARTFAELGIGAIIYTDISRDGMQTGINVAATRDIAIAAGVPVIASGGLAGLEDIKKLLAVESAGIAGVIIGKALYAGAVSLEAALALTTDSAPERKY